MSLEAEDVGAVHRLVHENGDVFDGERVELRGTANSEALAGGTVAAGDQHTVAPTDDTVELVRYGEQDTGYIIWESSVPEHETIPEPDTGCSWVDSESIRQRVSTSISGSSVCHRTLGRHVSGNGVQYFSLPD